VVAAVSRAGGFGVLGATAHSPETIEQELKMDRRSHRR
jgi:NAD(P)H-dependent flavin oxidoreductase YrpB (nitropropane dioxygenase family)